MLTPQVEKKFGYGWFLRERAGVWDVSYHKGDLPGYTSFFSRRQSHQQCIILLANVQDIDVTKLENKIAQILKKNYQ